MTDLEQRLTQLGRELDWPETPDLAPVVRRRLEAPARQPRRRPVLLRRSFAIAIAALLLLAGGVFAAVPGVRDAVLEFFGLQGATVERRAKLPEAPELRPLNLGTRTTLAARAQVARLRPAGPGRRRTPGCRLHEPAGAGWRAVARLPPRPGLPEAHSTSLGLLVGEFRGDLAPEYLGKIAGQATKIERLRVDGQRAIWIEGAPHLFFYRPPDSDFAESELRLAGNVLLLERGNLMVRLEGAFDRERALELARSLR